MTREPADAMGVRRAARTRDRRIAAAVERWFASAARPLPWRTEPRDPYRSLVSEFMLQQTQVSRVRGRFEGFVSRFPTVEMLAAADEQSVLAAWSGLGYYRRSRLLHAAARVIVERHAKDVPSDLDALRDLPGVGRYTAGAVASIAFGRAAPIVDGNVARVLMRVEGKEGRHQDPEVLRWAWERASDLVRVASSPGCFNEGLMEVGAVVCTPRNPGCERCPLSRLCTARRDGRQEEIPLPRKPTVRPRVFCVTALVRDGRDRALVRRRGADAMWAGMWEAPTVEGYRRPGRGAVAGLGFEPVRRIGTFEFAATHRLMRFEAWESRVQGRVPAGCLWKSPAELARLPMSSPQRRMLLGG
jgi:A/G-specific adenine glycosylase